MNARNVIIWAKHSHACDGEYSIVGSLAADAAIQALTAAGYSILRDDETHAPTVERAAEIADAVAEGNAGAEGWLVGTEIATAIRALIKEGGEDA